VRCSLEETVPVVVKICGVTNAGDARLLAEAGADAIGMNFWTGSKRRVDVVRAVEIARALPPSVIKVGVFVDAPRDEIERTIAAVGLDAIQLHGSESPEDCARFPVKVIKAIRVGESAESPAAIAGWYPVDYVLLDADAGAARGGSGRVFDWHRALDVAPGRLFLAGGLSPENVAAAVRLVRPYGVDAASSVESAPGQKDPRRVREFIDNAKHA
jgi:phosphoribosylanthranilate isomerase